jgi:hypothetical protein
VYSFEEIFLFVLEVVPDVSVYLLVDLDYFLMAKHLLHFIVGVLYQTGVFLLQTINSEIQLTYLILLTLDFLLETISNQTYMRFSSCSRKK